MIIYDIHAARSELWLLLLLLLLTCYVDDDGVWCRRERESGNGGDRRGMLRDAICPYARGIIHTVTHYPIENRFSLFLSRFDSLRDSLQRRDNDIIIAILYAHTRQYRYCV